MLYNYIELNCDVMMVDFRWWTTLSKNCCVVEYSKIGLSNDDSIQVCALQMRYSDTYEVNNRIRVYCGIVFISKKSNDYQKQ